MSTDEWESGGVKEGKDSDNTNMNPPQELQSTYSSVQMSGSGGAKEGKDSNITGNCVCISRLANLIPQTFYKVTLLVFFPSSRRPNWEVCNFPPAYSKGKL